MRRYTKSVFPIAALAGFFLLLEQSAATPAARAESFPSPPLKKREMRDQEARRVEAIFEELSTRKANGEDPGPRHRISESELNSYLSYLVEKENIAGVDALFVKLRQDSFTTYGIINVDKMQKQDHDAATRLLMQTILAGKQYLSAEGSLTARNGLGQYTLTGARINDVDIPPGIVNALINLAGKKQDPPFDLTKPFRLPYNIREAELGPGYLEVF